jgi:hypothetical protein
MKPHTIYRADELREAKEKHNSQKPKGDVLFVDKDSLYG